MVYPNGRTIDYPDRSGFRGLAEAAQHACRFTAPLNSGTNLNSALDNAIGRLDSIGDGANSGDSGQVLEQYSYLGLSTIVARNHPQDGINLTLVGSSGSIGSGGDQYLGLDQFGRIADQNWVNTSTGQSTDNFTYSYDGNSNVTAENNLLNTAYSQTFTYDPLNRVSSSTLGGVANQSWTLDSQGNWSSFTSNGTTQTETTNTQNQITSISGSTTPTYDANDNMTTDQSGNTYTYNAWNQLVTAKNASGQIIAQYSYDARGYRVSETYPLGGNGIPAGTTKYLYYSTQEQVIEERWNGTAASDVQYQYVWSASYVNATVLRDAYSGGVIQTNPRIYTQYDANYDVTALVGYNSTTQTWGVTERFTYSPYGTVTVLDANWNTTTDAYSWQYMYQGGREDPITGLYHFDHREYSASLGRFISQDPMRYINGANAYQFVMSNPVRNVDPLGQSWYNPQSWGWVQTTEGAVTDAVGVNGGAVAGAFWTGVGQGLGQEFRNDLNTYSQWNQSLDQGLADLGNPIANGADWLGRLSPIGVAAWWGTPENNFGVMAGAGSTPQLTGTLGGNTTVSSDGSFNQSASAGPADIDSSGIFGIGGQIPTEGGESPLGGELLFNTGMLVQELESLAKAARGWLDDYLPESNDSGLPSNYVAG